MPKFYVKSGRVQLVLTAEDAEQAAVRALRWSCDRQAEIYSLPAADLIREAEAMQYMLDDDIHVSETGFAGEGEVFEALDIAADRQRWAFR
jgi:hypothetical protein